MMIAIVGAGLLGRLLALRLTQEDHTVTLFDSDAREGKAAALYAGAGMLSPFSELETAEPLLSTLGLESLPLWEALLPTLVSTHLVTETLPVFFQKAGTLVVAHARDLPDLQKFQNRVKCHLPSLLPDTTSLQWSLSSSELAAIEPDLAGRFSQGYFLFPEGQVDNRELATALCIALLDAGITWHAHTHVDTVQAGWVDALGPDGPMTSAFDWVIDCRGLGARNQWPGLRGVRGEIIRVHAPAVTLNRPVRLMHPRIPLYIAPRRNHNFVIGATSIERDDAGPVTVQSALELLSAAYSVHPGFAEASIIEMQAQCRPTLSDHCPSIRWQPGLICVNGLYRHGFMITPALVQRLCTLIHTVALPDSPPARGTSPVPNTLQSLALTEAPLSTPLSPRKHLTQKGFTYAAS